LRQVLASARAVHSRTLHARRPPAHHIRSPRSLTYSTLNIQTPNLPRRTMRDDLPTLPACTTVTGAARPTGPYSIHLPCWTSPRPRTAPCRTHHLTISTAASASYSLFATRHRYAPSRPRVFFRSAPTSFPFHPWDVQPSHATSICPRPLFLLAVLPCFSRRWVTTLTGMCSLAVALLLCRLRSMSVRGAVSAKARPRQVTAW
jgi:hypothetical protein